MSKEDLAKFSTKVDAQLNADEVQEQETAIERANRLQETGGGDEIKDPIARSRLAIYNRAAAARDNPPPDDDEEEDEGQQQQDQGGDQAEDDAGADQGGTSDGADDGEGGDRVREPEAARTTLLTINGRTQPVALSDVQRLAQQALDAEAVRMAEAAKAAQTPADGQAEEAEDVDWKNLGEKIQLGDENDIREALSTLADKIRADVRKELGAGAKTLTAEEVDQRVATRLQQAQEQAQRQAAWQADQDATFEAYPALKQDRLFRRVALEETFAERVEDLVAYSKAPGARVTERQVRGTYQRALNGDMEAVNVIAANHEILQGSPGIRSRREVFMAAAKKIASQNPAWAKGSVDSADAGPSRASAETAKRKLTTQPRVAAARAITQRARQAAQPVDENTMRRKAMDEIMEARGIHH